MNSETRQCQNCKQNFRIEPEDFAFYERMQVPPPTFCWRCRAQRRLAWRNERFLSKRKSDFSGKDIFSMYPAESPVKVYEIEVWTSDQWDAMEYGREYDFGRPFMAQLKELIDSVPVFSRSVLYDQNSPYSSNFTGFKNCYLCFNGNDTEDSIYCTGIDRSKNCMDIAQANDAENCYDCFAVGQTSRNFGCVSCGESYNIYFCKGCIGCSDCIGCVNLRNKKYHIFNQPYSKEEFERKLKEFNLSSHSGYEALKREARRFWLGYPQRFMEGLKNEKVSGAYIANSKNAEYGYFVISGEDLKYCQYVLYGNKNCFDYSIWGENSSLVYESVVVGQGVSNLKFSHECWPEVRDSEYSFFSQSSSHLFGCSGLKNKQYCILNKQYAKEEYQALIPKIKAHMDAMPYKDKQGRVYKYGEFLPIEFSPFPYSRTMAQDQFPLSGEKAAEQGFFWREPEERKHEPTKSHRDLPENIADVPDSMTEEYILCAAWDEDNEDARKHNCTKVFRIMPQELAFYRHFGIPLPRKCWNSRHWERLKDRLPLNFFKRACGCAGEASGRGTYRNAAAHFHGSEPCPNEFQTAYAPEREEIVYCEACYNAEVV